MKYLFVAAHVDDNELSCGGTIFRLIEEGHDVTMVTLSHVYNGIDLIEEWRQCQTVIRPTTGLYTDFQTRYFRNQRQDILDYLLRLDKPDVVITHSSTSFHQDHSIVGEECIRAFKHSTILTFQQEWNNRNFIKNYFVKLEPKHIEKKIRALQSFDSQQGKSYIHPDFIWANALNNGVICGVKYAEAFNVINHVI